MQDDVIKVARLICNQMQDDDCACTSACGASIYAARAVIPVVLEEAAVRVERGPFVGPDAVAHAIQHAAAIRALKEQTGA